MTLSPLDPMSSMHAPHALTGQLPFVLPGMAAK
jgi:hypothetical protein